MKVRPMRERLRDVTTNTGLDVDTDDLRRIHDLARELLITELVAEDTLGRPSSGYLKSDSGIIIADYFADPLTEMDVGAYGGVNEMGARFYDQFGKDALKPVVYGISRGKNSAIRAMVSSLDPYDASFFLAGLWAGKNAQNKSHRFKRSVLEPTTDFKDTDDTWINHPLGATIDSVIQRGKWKMGWAHRGSKRTTQEPDFPDSYDAFREPDTATENWRKLAQYVLDNE